MRIVLLGKVFMVESKGKGGCGGVKKEIFGEERQDFPDSNNLYLLFTECLLYYICIFVPGRRTGPLE